MKKFTILALAAAVFAVSMDVAPARAARKYDDEIKQYIEDAKERKKERDKAERRARRNDPHRKLRPYQTLEEIEDHLDDLLEEHDNILSGGTYGKSVLGRDLRYVKLSGGQGDKARVIVSGNIHAQELAGGQMVLAALDELLEGYGKDCRITAMVDNADIYFVPVMNPDRMEKAARIQSRWGFTSFVRKNANGVDLNRNFPYPPGAPGRMKNSAGSPNRMSQTHRGPEPFSEPESRAFDRFVKEVGPVLSLNYHTSGGLILYGPGTYPDPPPDAGLLKEIAEAYRDTQFDKYEAEPAIELYPTLGDLDDYLYHHYGILAFTVEVGTGMEKRALIPRNGTWSPVFWAYNVYYLDREKANNVPGALAMIEYAIKVHANPGMRKWKPSDVLWVNEPEKR